MREREDYLRAYVPAELQRKLEEAGGRLRGERRVVTILFADTVGSTRLGETLDPETYQGLMNEVLGQMVEAVAEYEGMVARLQGDGLLAFFGAPLAHEDDPDRAVRAGLRLVERLTRLAEEVRQAFGLELSARVGIHTGPVIVGEFGSPLRLEYTAIGETINLASRIEGLAEPGTVLVSEDTWRLVAPLFEGEGRPPRELKGVSQPVATVRVLRARPAPGKPRGIEGLASPLVGRQAEMAQLRRAVEAVRQGRGRIVSLMGEPGIGKSRLVAELRREDPGLRWLEGRCLSYAEGVAFGPFQDLLREWLGVGAGEPPLKVRLQLQARLRPLFGDRFAEVYPYLGSMLGLPLEPEIRDRLSDLSPESLRRRIFDVVLLLVDRLSQERPLVMVFDDLHWADPASLELLRELLAVTEAAPVLLMLLFRPERTKGVWALHLHAQTERPHRFTALTLEPLSAQESEELLSGILQTAELPASLVGLLTERAEGNPFFLEELVRSLIQAGLLERGADGWLAAAVPERLEVPETVGGVIQARLDRLPEPAREILQAASVIGRIFPLRLLERIIRLDGQVRPALVELQRLDLVVERRRIPEPEYRFRHVLVQEVTYQSLLEEARRPLHLAVARALEDLHPDPEGRPRALLAHHLARAGLKEEAAHHLEQAGDVARLAYAFDEAVGHYEGAAELRLEAGDETGEARARLKIGLAHHRAGRYRQAQPHFEAAFGRLAVDRREPEAELRSVLLSTEPFDPVLSNLAWEAQVADHLLEGLVTEEPGGIAPAAAERWEVSEDGLEYRFHLRPDAVWSDGRPVTARDFDYALRRQLREPEAPQFRILMLSGLRHAEAFRAGETDELGVRAVGERTLELALERPVPHFLEILAHEVGHPAPRWAVERGGRRWLGPETFVGNGPFVPERWTEEELVLVANPRYTGSRHGNVRRLIFHFVRFGDWEAGLRAYVEGQVELAGLFGVRNIPEGTPASELHMLPGLGTLAIAFNHAREPFRHPNARRAFALALDRASGTSLGELAAAGGILPPALPGHSPHLDLPYDPDEARRLWERTCPGVRRLVSFRPPVGPDLPLEEAYKKLEHTLGVRIERRSVETYAEGIQLAARGELDLWHSGWSADYADPENFLYDWLRGTPGLQGWERSDYWEKVEAARRARDPEERVRLFREADRLLVEEEVALLPLSYGRQVCLVKPYVRGIRSLVQWGSLKDLIVEPH